jgi:hypothetical protein
MELDEFNLIRCIGGPLNGTMPPDNDQPTAPGRA